MTFFLCREDKIPICDVGVQNLNQKSRRGCFIAAVSDGKAWTSMPNLRCSVLGPPKSRRAVDAQPQNCRLLSPLL
jgi:hypothetical protein